MNAGGVDKACKSNAGGWTLETRSWKRYNVVVKNFQDLDVYKRASELFPRIYRLVRSWSAFDQRELGSQLIRAANSIHANLAEGFSKSEKDFKRYIGTAIGSCDEVVSHLTDAHHINLITEQEKQELVGEYEVVGKQLTRLKQSWKRL